MEATLAPTLLESISACCRRSGMAESTFGRRAVNDGKLVSRLREGARITPETLQRVNEFLRAQGEAVDPRPPVELLPLIKATDRPVRAINGAAMSTAPP